MGVLEFPSYVRDYDNAHIEDYENKKIGIDASVWLVHAIKDSYGPSLRKQHPKDSHVVIFLHRVKYLIDRNVRAHFVFDWARPPLKEQVKREAEEKARLKGGKEKEKEPKKWEKDFFELAQDVMIELKGLESFGITSEVSVFEADHRLAYLLKIGRIDAILSIDSDYIPLGCEHVIYDYDYDAGTCSVYRPDKLENNFSDYDIHKIQVICAFFGCDYVSRIPNFGPVKILDMVDMYDTWEEVLDNVETRFPVVSVPADYNYRERYEKALYAFRYPIVYDPEQNSIIHLNTLPNHLRQFDFSYLGNVDIAICSRISKGEIHPLKRKACSSATKWPSAMRRKYMRL